MAFTNRHGIRHSFCRALRRRHDFSSTGGIATNKIQPRAIREDRALAAVRGLDVGLRGFGGIAPLVRRSAGLCRPRRKRGRLRLRQDLSMRLLRLLTLQITEGRISVEEARAIVLARAKFARDK